MKKSQVLTALTFAFALGVVAPVVSLYVDGQSTYAVTEDAGGVTINDAIARAMQTATDGVTAESYKTLQVAVSKAEAADAEVANEMIDLIVTRFDTDSRGDYEGKTANEVLALAAEKHSSMSLAALKNKMKPLETNTEEILDCLKDDFHQDVEDIENLDAAVAAAKEVEKYSLYAELLTAVSEAEAVDEEDADATAAAIAKINAAITKITGQANAGEDDPSTDPGDDEGEGEGEGEGDDNSADVNQPADGKGEEAAAPEKGGKSPNTGTTGSASGTATAVSATSTVATIATGIFTLMRHLRQGKEA